MNISDNPPSSPHGELATALKGQEAKGAVLLASGTLLSRVLGFMRDMLFAYLLGPGADAFLVAFRLPNFMRRLLAEGSLGISYGAAAGVVLAGKGLEAARRMADGCAFALFCLSTPVVLLIALLARPIVFFIAPGLGDNALEHSAFLLRVCLPYIPLCLFSAIAFSHAALEGNFRPQAWAPALWNAFIILMGALALAWGAMREGFAGAEYILCLGIVGGGVLQAGIGLRCLNGGKGGFLPKGFLRQARGTISPLLPDPAEVLRATAEQAGDAREGDQERDWGGRAFRERAFSPVVSVFLRDFPKAVLGAAPHQLHIVAGTIAASLFFPGAVSSLYFAERLVELPLGIAGAALGLATLPLLAKLAARGDLESMAFALRQRIVKTAFLSFPAAAGLFSLAHPLASALFGHGAFTADAVAASAAAIRGYCFAIPALCAARPLLSALHALGNGGVAMRCSLLSLIPVFLLAFSGIVFLSGDSKLYDKPLLCIGVALSAGAWSYAALLLLRIKLAGLRLALREEKKFLLYYAMGALVLACLLSAFCHLWGPPGMVATLVLIVGCICLWFAGFRMLGSKEALEILSMLKR